MEPTNDTSTNQDGAPPLSSSADATNVEKNTLMNHLASTAAVNDLDISPSVLEAASIALPPSEEEEAPPEPAVHQVHPELKKFDHTNDNVLEAASIALPPSAEEEVPSPKDAASEAAVLQVQSSESRATPPLENAVSSMEEVTPQNDAKADHHEEPLTPPTVIQSVDSKEESTTEDSNPLAAPEQQGDTPLPWWYPKFRGRPVFYGTKEALGWACTAVAQASILVGVGAFMLPAIAKLAKEQAGCETEAPSSAEDIPECHGKVYGIKPSSLLTLLSSIVGLASAFIIPPVGAVVDFTNHRRLIGRWVSVFYALGILCMVFLSEDSWLALAVVLSVSLSISWAQTMLMNAYLPELTTDENRLNEFSKTFTVLIFCTMVLCLAVVMGIAIGVGFHEDDVALARCAALVGFVFSAFLFYASWWLLFEEKQAMHQLPPGQNLVGAGFRQVGRTAVKIWTQYRGLKWFYISICFGDAAIQSLSVIAITYTTDQLEFNSQEVAQAALLLLLGSIPGAIVGAWFNKNFNPVRSSALSVFGMMGGTGLAAIILTGPGQQYLTFCFAFLWGFGTGWKYTGDRVLAAGIVPAGQDAELMGFYMFCGQVFAWVPSLVYTLLNEAGVSQRIGLSTLCVVFLGALLSYIKMGDYSEAVAAADRLRVDSIPSVQQQRQKETIPEDMAAP